MGKIHAMMDIGKRTMQNSQTALQTVAHNIANKTTEGYSRQRVDLTTAPSINEGKYQMGMGARAAQVTRINNPYLDKQLQLETGVLGFHEGQSDAMAKVEQIFNEQLNKGLNQYVTDFFNAFRELSNNPESTTSRVIVKEASEALVDDFHRVNTQMDRIQKEIDFEIKQNVEEINNMTKEIASLNQKIATIELQGAEANDERDRRDVLVKQLHERIDIKIADADNGMISVSTAGNALLVSSWDAMALKVQIDPDTKRNHVYYQPTTGTLPFDVTNRVKGGRLGGQLQIRDDLIPDLREKIDNIAVKISDEVNNAHIQGFDRRGRTGLDFFTFADSEGSASANIGVNDEILRDVTRIASGAKPGAPGDNTIANVISLVQFKENMDGSTIDDYYNAQVGRVGVIANGANKSLEAQKNIIEQVNKIRESVSGVSLDEEATKMLEFQKAFDASARVIRTADEMLETVLNLKRM